MHARMIDPYVRSIDTRHTQLIRPPSFNPVFNSKRRRFDTSTAVTTCCVTTGGCQAQSADSGVRKQGQRWAAQVQVCAARVAATCWLQTGAQCKHARNGAKRLTPVGASQTAGSRPGMRDASAQLTFIAQAAAVKRSGSQL